MALTLLSSRLSNGPGGSSRQRNSLTARLFRGKKIRWGTNKFTKNRKQSYFEARQCFKQVGFVDIPKAASWLCVFTQKTKRKYKIYRRCKDFKPFSKIS